jgi:hypothetical protein
MVTFIAGTDTYGRVKPVGGTPIVTKFAMLHFLPLYPLQSYYFLGRGKPKWFGIPFVARSHTVAIDGIPLARLDRVSVAMAYLRGLLGALVLVGFLSIVPGIMHLAGEHLDDFAMIMLRGMLFSLAIGSIGGLLTYALPLTSRREHGTRTYCGSILGICIDPARVPVSTAAMIQDHLNDLGLTDPVDPDKDARSDDARALVLARAQIALGLDRYELERKTDELLDRLNHLERVKV